MKGIFPYDEYDVTIKVHIYMCSAYFYVLYKLDGFVKNPKFITLRRPEFGTNWHNNAKTLQAKQKKIKYKIAIYRLTENLAC